MRTLRVLVPPTLSDPGSVAVLRSTGRDAALVTLGALGAAGGLLTLQSTDPALRLWAAAVTVAVLVVGWAGFVRPRLVVAPADLTVVGAVRTRRVPWADVASFEAGVGLVVRLRDGHSIAVSALPNRVFEGMRGGPSLPESAAVALGDRLVRVRETAGSSPGASAAVLTSRAARGVRWSDVLPVLVGAGGMLLLLLLLDR